MRFGFPAPFDPAASRRIYGFVKDTGFRKLVMILLPRFTINEVSFMPSNDSHSVNIGEDEGTVIPTGGFYLLLLSYESNWVSYDALSVTTACNTLVAAEGDLSWYWRVVRRIRPPATHQMPLLQRRRNGSHQPDRHRHRVYLSRTQHCLPLLLGRRGWYSLPVMTTANCSSTTISSKSTRPIGCPKTTYCSR